MELNANIRELLLEQLDKLKEEKDIIPLLVDKMNQDNQDRKKTINDLKKDKKGEDHTKKIKSQEDHIAWNLDYIERRSVEDYLIDTQINWIRKMLITNEIDW